MASQEQLNQLQGLYIAYFGRPNDAAGIEYWGAEIDSGVSFDEIATRFMESDEFTASSSDLNDVVRAAYTNALGRDAGDEEVAYWVGRLEAGDVSVAGLLETFRSTDDATDSATLENKITVANAYTEAAVSGAGFDVAASKTALASVDETQASVDAALEGVGSETPADLNAAVLELQEAEQARAEFLDGALDNEAIAEEAQTVAGAGNEPTSANVATAIANVANGAALDVQSLATAGSVDYSTSFVGASAAVRSNMISEVLAAYEKAVSDEQADVNEVAGLSSAIASLAGAKESYAAAATAAAAAETNLAGEVARFEALNSGVTVSENAATPTTPYSLTVSVNDGTTTTDYDIALSGRTLVAEAGLQDLDLVGLDALVQDAQSLYNANASTVSAEGSLAAAVAKALNLENGNTTLTADAVLGASAGTYYSDPVDSDNDGDLDVALGTAFSGTEIDSLIQAQEDLASFTAAVEAYTEAQQLNASLVASNQAVTDAQEAIEDLDYVLGTTVGSADSDVFVFADADVSITGFGAQGDDVLFLGQGYDRVDLGAAANLNATAQGDSAQLEVFFQQDGVDAKIFVEGAAFAGSATNGFQGNVITLTGVSIEDISLSSDGFLTVA